MRLFRQCSPETKEAIVKGAAIIILYGVCLLLPQIPASIAAENNAKSFCKEPDHKAACAVFKDNNGYTVASSIGENAGIAIFGFSWFVGALAFGIIYSCMRCRSDSQPDDNPQSLSLNNQ